ncbi:MAG: SMP-30/gluconolactonase/LRE family protein [candidate division WOR-3 bacterium]|nr:SMP-30/gluconolactonase/LRE family protein [candidate division WOR-3 bacterium]
MQFALFLALIVADPTTLLVPPFSHTMGFNRIGRLYISMYLGMSFKLDDPEGMCGAKMVEEDDPSTSNDDHILTMFGVNSGSSQIVYNVKLIEPRLYGSPGKDTNHFNHPHGICCNKYGTVYVADTDNDRVVRLKYHDTRLTWAGVIPNDELLISNGEAKLKAPRDVAIDSHGRVYVADSGNNRVVVFDSLGALVTTWTADLEGPTGICVMEPGADYNDFGLNAAVVIDQGRTRISQFSLDDGRQLRTLDMRRIGLDEAGFAYCAYDRHGNVYVTDQLNSQIHLFDPELKYIVSFGRQGIEGTTFQSPTGIAIWRRFGQVFISEANGGQYYWLGLDAYLIGFYPTEFDSLKPGTTIALYVTEMADITVDITDPSGKLVRSLAPPHLQHPGEVLIVWDGRDNAERLVAKGEYRVTVTARPTYSRPMRILKKELTGTVRRV